MVRLTECVIYNILFEGQHPSTICVEIALFDDSLKSLLDLSTSGFVREEFFEFIEHYARKDTISPHDRTVGFAVLNTAKKIISVSLNGAGSELASKVERILADFKKSGYHTELEVDS